MIVDKERDKALGPVVLRTLDWASLSNQMPEKNETRMWPGSKGSLINQRNQWCII